MNKKKSSLKKYKISQLKKGKKIVHSQIFTSQLLDKSLIFLNDNHPIHHNNSWAKKLGFNSKIFPGFAVISIFSNLIGTKLPGINCVIADLQFSFKQPIYVGDKLKFTCQIAQVYKELKIIRLNLTIIKKNKRVIQGTCTCKIF